MRLLQDMFVCVKLLSSYAIDYLKKKKKFNGPKKFFTHSTFSPQRMIFQPSLTQQNKCKLCPAAGQPLPLS